MGMELGFQQGFKHELNHDQKLALKQLFELSQSLRREGPPEAVRGIEGLKAADNILKARNIEGILIGGLSEAVWNKRNSGKDFDSHKDVDVLVRDLKGNAIGDFEGGIDWWLPRDAQLDIRYEMSTLEGKKVRFWENANNIKLAFGINDRDVDSVNPGLYIPPYDFVRDMRRAEALAVADTARVGIDYDVEESFVQKLNKRIKEEKSPTIKREFNQMYLRLAIEVFDHETFVAINSSR